MSTIALMLWTFFSGVTGWIFSLIATLVLMTAFVGLIFQAIPGTDWIRLVVGAGTIYLIPITVEIVTAFFTMLHSLLWGIITTK
ncbi:hypothetical protein GMB30_01670 [Turicibacter sanguinis]|nr:hypothetical protein [Turicibacter sanguinis]MTN05699.1 hypothetical protein [Turicibacter sanguinis]